MLQERNIISHKALIVWQIRAAAVFTLFSAADIVVLIFSAETAFVIWLFAAALFLAVRYFIIPKEFSACRCFVSDESIYSEKGIFLHKRISVSFKSIQYCLILRTPCERIHGICTVVLLCAGSFETVRGLSLRDAVSIDRQTRGFANAKQTVL